MCGKEGPHPGLTGFLQRAIMADELSLPHICGHTLDQSPSIRTIWRGLVNIQSARSEALPEGRRESSAPLEATAVR